MSKLRHAKPARMSGSMPKAPTVPSMSDNDEDDMPMKKGGKVKKRARGGAAESDDAEMPKRPRMDRPGRKRGGRAGADMAPLSSASKNY